MKALFTILLLAIQLVVVASTLEVGVGKQFTSIKSAIEASKDGDVILIHKGVYTEGEIFIPKNFIGILHILRQSPSVL